MGFNLFARASSRWSL
jgi:hypothetical protein